MIFLHTYPEIMLVDDHISYLKNIKHKDIEEGNVYRNELQIKLVNESLNKHNKCLIRADEGRGKTVFTRIIAYDYYTSGTRVYFLDFKNSNLDSFKLSNFLRICNESSCKHLIIFDNVQANYALTNVLVDEIDKYVNNDKFYFLIASRFLKEKENDYDDPFYDWTVAKNPKLIVDLEPNLEDVKGILSIYSKFSGISIDDSVKTEIFNKVNFNLGKKEYINLRLLNIYLVAWEEERENDSNSEFSSIDENVIYRSFLKAFNIYPKSSSEKDSISYLCAVYQFDVPLALEQNDREHSDNLEIFAKEGFCTKIDNEYHFAHATDAQYLFKSLCKGNLYSLKTKEYIMKYFDLMVSNPKPQFEQYSGRILRGLFKTKNQEILSVLCAIHDFDEDSWVFKLAPINASIIQGAITNAAESKQNDKAISFWKANRIKFKPFLLSGYPLHVIYLNNILSKIGYFEFCSDIFKDDLESTQIVLTKMLLSSTKGGFINRLLISIENLSEEHKNLVIHFRKERQSGHIDNEVIYPFFDSGKESEVELNNYIINGKYYFWLKQKTWRRALRNLYQNGFFLSSELSWGRLGQFFGYIRKHIAETPSDETIGICVAKKIIDKILYMPEVLQYATDEEMSLWLNHIGMIDKVGLYEEVMNNWYFKLNMQKRLEDFKFTKGTLYLAGHLYPAVIWKEKDLENVIKKATEEDKSEMGVFINKITSQDNYVFNRNDFIGFLQVTLNYIK